MSEKPEIDPVENVAQTERTVDITVEKMNDLLNRLSLMSQDVQHLRTVLDDVDLKSVKDAMLSPKPVEKAPYPELAATIVDNSSYSQALVTSMKRYIDKVSKSAIRRVIIFQNKTQMVKDVFPQYVKDRGLQMDFDTMWSIFRTTTVAERKEYMEIAAKFATAFHFDDIHNNTPEELGTAVKFMRDFTDKPIYGTLGADDYRLVWNKDGTPVIDPVTKKQKREKVDVAAFKQAGLLITRQFFRQGESADVVKGWLNSGRIIDGVNLEAYREGVITTSDGDFEEMLLLCVEAGMPFLSVYAIVNTTNAQKRWEMWEAAPALWNEVNRAARILRMLKIQK